MIKEFKCTNLYSHFHEKDALTAHGAAAGEHWQLFCPNFCFVGFSNTINLSKQDIDFDNTPMSRWRAFTAINTTVYEGDICFVPVPSALTVDITAVTTSAVYANESTSGPQAPDVDDFIAQESLAPATRNTTHILYTPRNSQWLFEKIQGQQATSTNFCAAECSPFSVVSTVAAGQSLYVYDQVTFSVANVPAATYSVTWSVSNGTPGSGSGPSISVNPASAGVVTATATITPLTGSLCPVIISRSINVVDPIIGDICGRYNYYAGTNDFYIDPVPGAMGYRWMLLDHPPQIVTGNHFSVPITEYEWPNTFTVMVAVLFRNSESAPVYATFEVDENGVGSLCNLNGFAALTNTLYPNPAVSYFKVDTKNLPKGKENKAKFNVKVYDKNGRIKVDRKNVDENTEISTEAFSDGFYHVVIAYQGKSYTAKLQVRR